MANSYKDIIITPNRSNTADPKIEFRGANSTVNTAITIQTYPTSNGTLSFEGSAGQLFSITNDLTGSIFSVNDVSGIPSLEIFANGQINMAQYGGNVVFGNTSTLSAYRLLVTGNTSPQVEVTGEASSHAYISVNRASASAGEVGLLFKSAGGVDWYNYESTSGTTLKWYAGGADRLQLSNTGILTATGDMRAPAFYDSDNTGYYINPAATSNMAQASFQDYIRITNAGGAQHLLMGNQDSGGTNSPAILTSANKEFNFGYGNTWTGDGGTKTYYSLMGSGYAQHNTSYRAPVFYDSDDTNYYIDPNSTSSMSTIKGSQYSVGYTNPFDAINASPWYGLGRSNVDGSVVSNTMVHLAGYYGLRLRSSGYILDIQGSSGVPFSFNDYGQFANSIRAPIFYDSDNTGYYIDAANSNVALNINGRILGGFGAHSTSGTLDWNDSTNARSGSTPTLLLGNATNGPGGGLYYHPFSFEYGAKDGTGQLTQFAIRYADTADQMYMRGRYSNVWSGWTEFLTSSSITQTKAGILQSSASVRAPIFYDSDNTTYCVDGSGTSVLNALRTNGLTRLMSSIYVSPTNVNTLNSGYGGDNDTDDMWINYRGFADGMTRFRAFNLGNGKGTAYLYGDGTNQRIGIAKGQAASYTLDVGGIVYSNTSVRAPIFYDSDNTSYFLDCNSTSVLSTVRAATIQHSSGNAAIDLNGATYLVLRDAGGTSRILLGSDFNSYYNNNAHYFRNNSLATKFTVNDTYAQHVSSVRAPIFYDSDNTSYYVDPAGTSYVNIVQLADTGAIVFNDRGRDAATVTLPNWLNRSVRWDFVTASSAGSGGSYAGMMTFSPWSGTTASTGDASYQMIFGSTAVNGGGVPQLRIRNGIDTTWNSFYNIHHDGYADMYATSSFRAPIFYDSNNTGFYVDPNGSCNISYLKVNSNMDVEYNSGGTWMGIGIRNNYASASVNASHFIDFKNENGYVKNSVHSHLVTDGSGYLTWSATAPAVSRTADSRTTIGFAYYNQWDFATSAGIKSNIYYDRDNTNFYVDPNSTSQLYYIRTGNVINIGGVLGDATVAGTNFHGIEFHSEGNRDYYIGKPAGAWTQPLHIHFYTGVWYRAHSDYGGHRFYNLNDGGLKFSVADGDNNVRSIANFYAPIMYDYDNTAYYVDPASSSNVNNLTVAGTLTATISGYAALSGANFTGGISTTGDLGVGSEINMTGAATKYFDHNGTLNFRYSDNSSFFTQAFQINSGIYTVASGSSRAPVFYDSDDTGYYTDPASNTRLRNINLGGGSGFDATIHIIGAQGGNGRLTQMSPNTSSTGGLNLISSRNASNADQWWIWGVSAANYWYCNSGTGFNSSTGFTVDGSGNMTAAGNITAYSDLKLKENIEHITSPLEKVLNMRGVFYNLKQDEQKKRRVGVIAQEVIEILPEVVIAHKDPDDQGMSDTTLSVDYGNMAGLFIEAIKEQQEIIEEQSAKINSLEAKLNEILTLLGNH